MNDQLSILVFGNGDQLCVRDSRGGLWFWSGLVLYECLIGRPRGLPWRSQWSSKVWLLCLQCMHFFGSKFFLRLKHSFQPSLWPNSSSSVDSLAMLPFPLVLDSVPFPKPNYKVPITPTPTSNLHLLAHLRCSKPPTHFTGAHHKLLRKYSFESNESVEELDCNKEVVMINHKFVEAREEIEIAMESKETEFWWESGVHSGCCEGSVTCLKGYWPSC